MAELSDWSARGVSFQRRELIEILIFREPHGQRSSQWLPTGFHRWNGANSCRIWWVKIPNLTWFLQMWFARIPHSEIPFIAVTASSLGAAITMPICGFLISEVGWESVFYVTGGIGVIWSLFWFIFVFDSPAQHPRISDDERRYIQEAIGTTSTTKVSHENPILMILHQEPMKAGTISFQHLSVPWKAIFTSAPVWAIIITHGCSVFGYFTVVNQLPTYMKYILNFNIKEVNSV